MEALQPARPAAGTHHGVAVHEERFPVRIEANQADRDADFLPRQGLIGAQLPLGGEDGGGEAVLPLIVARGHRLPCRGPGAEDDPAPVHALPVFEGVALLVFLNRGPPDSTPR